MHASFTDSQVEHASDAIPIHGNGRSIAIPDALLFGGNFKRSGDNLTITGEDDQSVVLLDYFKADGPVPLVSAQGAALSATAVATLAKAGSPQQFAQAGVAAAGAAPIGTVDKVSGNVTVMRNGATVTLAVGERILKSDVVQTGSGSTVAIVLIDGTLLNLGEGTRMAMNEFNFDPNSTANSSLLSLVQGSFAFVAGQVAATGGLNIETPVATMGIRGTAGGGVCGGSTCSFAGEEGSYELTVAGQVVGRVTVSTGATIAATLPGQPPIVNFIPTANIDPVLTSLIRDMVAAYPQLFVPPPPTSPAQPQKDGSNTGSSTGPGILAQTDGLPPQIPPITQQVVVLQPLDPQQQQPVVVTVKFMEPPTANQTPVVSNPIGPQEVKEDAPWTFTIPAGTFTDPENATLTYTATQADGSALPNWLMFDPATGTFSGTPPLNANGVVQLRVVVSDGTSSVANTFVLNVLPVNDAPVVANVIADQSLPEDTAWSFTVPTNAFSDVDGDTLSYTASLGNGGVLPAWLSFDASSRTFSGTPPHDFNGALELRVTASDGTASVSDTFTLTITPLNDAPVVVNAIANQSLLEDAAWSFTAPANTFFDVDGDPLSYTANLGNGGALPAWLSFDAASRTFSGTPPLNFNGTLDLQVTASDGTAIVSDTFTLTIVPVNDAPVVAHAIADQSLPEDASWNFQVPANTFSDVDGDALSYSASLGNGGALPAWLSFDAASRTFSGTPPENFNGAIDLRVMASDGVASISDTFTLTIAPVDDALVLVNVIANQSLPEDTAWNFVVPANTFFDPDGDPLTYAASLGDGGALPTWLSFDAASRTFSGTPPQNFNGALDLRVTASDGTASVSDTFTLNVTSVNDAPVAAPVTLAAIAEDTPERIITAAELLAGVSDVDGPAATITALSISSGLGTLTPVDATSWRYVPVANDDGSVTFSYTVSDGTQSASSTATLDLTPVNDAPVAGPVTLAAAAEDEERIITAAELLAGVSDVDGPAATITALSISSGLGMLTPVDATSWRYVPAANDDSSVTFSYTASDGTASASSTATLDLTPVNDAPTAGNITLEASLFGNVGFGAIPNFSGWTVNLMTSGSSPSSSAIINRSPTFAGDDAVAVLEFSSTVSSYGHAFGPSIVSGSFFAEEGSTFHFSYRLSTPNDIGQYDAAMGYGYIRDAETNAIVHTIFNYDLDNLATTLPGTTGVRAGIYTFADSGYYNVEFRVGSYDYTGGTVVGAVLELGEAGISRDEPFKFDPSALLANSIDVDGDNLELWAVAPTSDLGASLILEDGVVTYNASSSNQLLQDLAAGQTIVDHFTFTVSDGHGGLTNATAAVSLFIV